MPEHENKICPRCEEAFECKAGNITQCRCSHVQLSPEEREYIGSLFSDCVCSNCLLQLKNEFVQSGKISFLQAKMHR